MKGAARLAALSMMLLDFPLLARDLSNIYDDAALWAVREKYERSVKGIYDQLILPGLKQSEKRTLQGVRLHHPLRSLQKRGEYAGYPFGFFTTADHSTVVMPLFSLKFLHDTCAAYAWLQINGYSIETVSEYIGMLRYGLPKNLPPGRYPSPLEALHIPKDASSNLQVKELTDLHFTTARAFILGHELGHIIHNHPPYTFTEKRRSWESEEIRRNEAEADSFALDVLEGTGITPLGALVFFLADAHLSPKRVDFGSEQEFKEYFDSYVAHPLTPDRVQLLANKMHRLDLEDRAVMARIAEFLKDEDIQRSYILSGEATGQDALGPRRPKQLLSRMWPTLKTRENPLLPFDGFYSGEYVRYISGEQESLPVEANFERRGDSVTGCYSFGLGQGVIEGQVKGNTLYFSWEWGRNSGNGLLQSLNGTGFSGTWGYRESSDRGGKWTGQRTK
jgi:hypothetical protein